MTEQAPAPLTWTFKPLDSTKRGVIITKCQGFLSNRMQCTRAGEFEGFDEANVSQGQFCKKHMLVIQALLDERINTNVEVANEEVKIEELKTEDGVDTNGDNPGATTTS